MIPLSLAHIADVTRAKVSLFQHITINDVSTDTRTVSAGSLFIALVGERFDAHDFVVDAVAKGASAVMVAREIPEIMVPQLVVADTKIALGQLAADVRQQMNLKVAAITGSCGKTTLKEMCAAILGVNANVLATLGNLNNEIGVPQTLLRLTPELDYAVVELGANHAGEIAWTTSLTKPDVAIINNVGAAHLAGFGSIEGVAVAKTEIFNGLSESGTAVINADSEFYHWWREILTVNTVSFGVENSDADFKAINIQQDDAGIASFEMITPSGSIDIQLTIPGLHNVNNALAAAAVTTALGISLSQVKVGLSSMKAVKGRFCVERLTPNLTVIDDTYNASVKSVMAAIDTLSVMPGYKVFTFGDMGELGDEALKLHADIGLHAKEKNIDLVLSVGPLSTATAQAAGGLHFESKNELCLHLHQIIKQQPTVTILAKGARSSRMEDIVNFVKSCEEATC